MKRTIVCIGLFLHMWVFAHSQNNTLRLARIQLGGCANGDSLKSAILYFLDSTNRTYLMKIHTPDSYVYDSLAFHSTIVPRIVYNDTMVFYFGEKYGFQISKNAFQSVGSFSFPSSKDTIFITKIYGYYLTPDGKERYRLYANEKDLSKYIDDKHRFEKAKSLFYKNKKELTEKPCTQWFGMNWEGKIALLKK
jgi:hypothetical protein